MEAAEVDQAGRWSGISNPTLFGCKRVYLCYSSSDCFGYVRMSGVKRGADCVRVAFPDSRVNLIFLPFFTFPIGAGVGAMVCAAFTNTERCSLECPGRYGCSWSDPWLEVSRMASIGSRKLTPRE